MKNVLHAKSQKILTTYIMEKAIYLKSREQLQKIPKIKKKFYIVIHHVKKIQMNLELPPSIIIFIIIMIISASQEDVKAIVMDIIIQMEKMKIVIYAINHVKTFRMNTPFNMGINVIKEEKYSMVIQIIFI